MIVKTEKTNGLIYIYNDAEIYCIILKSSFENVGITFFTDDNFSQQLGYLSHTKGSIIKPHLHKITKREVFFTHEVLFIKRGAVKINFYDDQKNWVDSEMLNAGDVILLCGGGHGFEILEDTAIIEVKQGPYMGMEDKERFKGVENDSSK